MDFVTIDMWTMIFTWLNLIILFLLLKKFLFGPVNKILLARAEEIETAYTTAESAKREAAELRGEYEQQIRSAKDEADGIVKSAVSAAKERSESIVNEAQETAQRIAEKSREQIEIDKKNALREARGDIASMAVDVAEKLIGERISDSADDKLIESIIDKI
ncbi:MAG: F0F1 ATP synthase subunit B [Clostridia bacterium]|nr:F0F1 ATP synthase subunit B [Clostridia bacterium]